MKSEIKTLLFCMLLSYQAAFGQSMGLALEGDEWKDVQEHPVSGKNNILSKRNMAFGEFRCVDADRSWTKGTIGTTGLTQGTPTDAFYKKVITVDEISKKQTLYFSLGDTSGNRSKAFCLSKLDAEDFNIGNSPVSALNLLLDIAGPGIESSNVFYSKIYIGQSTESWDLFIDNQAAVRNPEGYVGYLARDSADYYSVTPTAKVRSKSGKTGSMPFGSAGFIIRDREGTALAAVSVIDKGIIYLKPLEPREKLLLATACAALLLRPADL